MNELAIYMYKVIWYVHKQNFGCTWRYFGTPQIKQVANVWQCDVENSNQHVTQTKEITAEIKSILIIMPNVLHFFHQNISQRVLQRFYFRALFINFISLVTNTFFKFYLHSKNDICIIFLDFIITRGNDHKFYIRICLLQTRYWFLEGKEH